MDKKTFLHDEQLKAGAKMVSFAGWEMPVQYSGIIDEHNAVRNDAGLFDVSHMGQIFVYGKDVVAYLQNLVPQSIEKLEDKKAVYCQLTNDNGGIIDDLIIYKLETNQYLLIVNASRLDKDYDWFVKNTINYNVHVENKSELFSMFAIQGPKATDIIAETGLSKDNQPEFFTILNTDIFGIDVFISRTGYTGEDGFEIIVRNEFAIMLWNCLLDTGKKFGLKPIGLGARDTLRLEAALPLYGNDLSEKTTPVEAQLKWSFDINKKENYHGKNVILTQINEGINKKMIAFKMIDKAIARHEYKIYYNESEIGEVTSGCYSPTLKENIGLGYIQTSTDLKTDDIIQIMVRNKLYNAKIVKKPFVAKNYKK